MVRSGSVFGGSRVEAYVKLPQVLVKCTCKQTKSGVGIAVKKIAAELTTATRGTVVLLCLYYS